ncbi:hypothetical protein Dimus_027531 [Dionaea muscipula]
MIGSSSVEGEPGKAKVSRERDQKEGSTKWLGERAKWRMTRINRPHFSRRAVSRPTKAGERRSGWSWSGRAGGGRPRSRLGKRPREMAEQDRERLADNRGGWLTGAG